MADRGITVGSAELTRLVAALDAAPAKTGPAIRAVVQRGALNVKNSLNRQAASSTHFKGMSGSVTYETQIRRDSITGTIGPDKNRRGGALGNLFFFGGAHGGGGTGDIDAPLREEEPRLMEHLRKATEELL